MDDISGDFPTGGKTYLNNASVSITPHQTIKAMADFLTMYSSVGPDSAESDLMVTSCLQKARAAISEMIGCRPDELVLTQSTTDGINAVARGLNLNAGSNLIIRGAAHEHHSNYYPWLRLAGRVELRSLPINADGLFEIDKLRRSLDAKTGLVALSHALYNTGAILPVAEIGELLEKRGTPYFVDAAQTAGCLEFDVKKIRCNFMAFNGSKWLCGPMGIGLFYCARDSAEMLEPLAIGGESAIIYDDTKLAHKEMPARFQAGFRNYAGAAGLESAARYILRYGVAGVRKKVMRLAGMLREGLAEMPGVRLYGPDEPERRTSIVSFNVSGTDPQQVVARLESEMIVLAVREAVDTKMVRAAPHFFNTESQISDTLGALSRL